MTDNSPLRWHSNPDPRLRLSGDTVDTHQLRVVELCRDLAARSGHELHGSDLLYAARYHDAAEAVLGDMPGPAKDRFPALAAAYAIAERQVLAEMGHSWRLSNYEAEMLDLCDKLDAYLWAERCGCTDTDEWHAALAKLRRRAHALGPDAMAWLEDRLTQKEVTA